MSRHDPSTDTAPTSRQRNLIPLREATRAWFLISLQTFGGPAGQIAVMQRTLVDEKRWIGQKRFLHALNYCMLLPGPEAQQLAIYTGWLLNGTLGGLIAGVLFVLPGMLAMLGLAAIYVAFGTTTVVLAVFAGIAPAVLAVVVQAVTRVAKRALTRPAHWVIAVAAFLALALFAIPFPIVIAVAGLAGWAVGRHGGNENSDRPDTTDELPPLIADDALHADAPSARRAILVVGAGLLAWAIPMVAVVAFTGRGSVFTEQGMFFSGTALVTFGGAYAVLAYVAQKAVETYGWLTPGEMVRGLGLAETTPGPLIMVVQFVAFLGAYRNPGDLDPWAAATLGALLTTWVTFVPCFVFIFLGAPYVERLRHNHHLTAALSGITASVVGVIANLALYFAVHTLFADTAPVHFGPFHLLIPEPGSFRPLALVIGILAGLMIYRLGWSVLRTLGVCALLGLAAGLVGVPVT
ncbi:MULTISPECIES: chromate efflux transporter [unclassified Rhodococcus (in: high G+C Gram-positive bacteria)]|uniref:chromate efflux transporter n=1 Tax=unclassified Rhodococcus (in: high G+C Gram-positive bacteria) TaxID=192944 RepID=UPI00163AE5FA|nr:MULTISPECIES: chromate efflux transporter [unclassified Rhodococcus (in: high G+C Gram-positive bacteria)]MBC2640821.1 chromate efflux transporter [Rhodococcus sp. 3A]MBC2894435.1 chromate efflux transporter [Rhodococcus sp. 4CII]